ncbi:MAG TPA: hypothetical protein VK698_04605 [Kofleriaceae bacterium]|nr:hypothetical protein [Kofleriaceae bacterium]
MANVVTASYETREEAEHATERLIAAGLLRQEISMLAPEENGGSFAFSLEPRKRIMAGVGGGALLGLVIGAICGAVLALVPLDIPQLAELPFDPVAMGPILSALIGAGAGAAVGGFLGALVGLGRTGHEAVVRAVEDVPGGGYVLVGVSVPREMMRSAVHVLATAGAHKIKRS